jgi:hypothetical protein
MSASFRRLAKARIATRYRYAKQEVDDIEEALLQEVKETIDAFRNGSGSRRTFLFGDEKPTSPPDQFTL